MLSIFANAQKLVSESFESGTIPATWKVIDNNSDTYKWYAKKGSYVANDGLWGIEVRNDTGFDDYIISPEFTVSEGAVLSFGARTSYGDGAFKVMVSKGGQLLSGLTIELGSEDAVKNTWKVYEYVLTDHADISAGDKICFALWADPRNTTWLRADNFVVEVPAANPIAEVNKSTVNLTAENGFSATSANVVLSNTGKDGLTITGVTDLAGSPFATTLTAAEAAKVNLSKGETTSFTFTFEPTAENTTNKDFVINTNGGDITVKLTGIGTAKVAAVTNIEEGFEGVGVPANWSLFDGNGDGKTWIVSSSRPNSGTQSMEAKRSTVANDEWLISPRIEVKKNSMLVFYAKSSYRWNNDHIEVLLSKTGRNTSKDFTVELVAKEKVPSSAYKKYEIDLSTVAGITVGDEVIIAIKSVSGSGSYSLYVDDFSVTPPPPMSLNTNVWNVQTDVNKTVNSGDVFEIINNTESEITINSVTDLSATPFTTTVAAAQKIAVGGKITFGISYAPTAEGDNVIDMVIATTAGDVTIKLNGKANAKQTAVETIKEDFESGALAANWKIVNNNGDAKTWEFSSSGLYVIDGDKSLVIKQSSSETHDDWLILPLLKVKSENKLKIWFQAKNDDVTEKVNVFASKTGYNPADFTIKLKENYNASRTADYVTIDLSGHADINVDDEIYIAIQSVGKPSTSSLKNSTSVDNITVAPLSDKADITFLSFPGQLEVTDINTDTKIVTAEVPYATDLTAVKPFVGVSPFATAVIPDDADFSGDVIIKVTAENGTVVDWTVKTTKTAPSTEKMITKMFLYPQAGTTVLDEGAKTVLMYAPAGADLTKIAPRVIVSKFAKVSPATMLMQDFSAGSVTYTVTAQDGSTQEYVVTVEFAPSDKAITAFTIPNQVGATVITEADKTILVKMPAGTDVTALVPTITTTKQAGISPATGVATDFTNPVTYTVTALDESTQDYTVTVEEVTQSTENKILTFTVPNQIGETVISHDDPKTVKVVVPRDVNLSKILPAITISDNAKVAPATNVITDFAAGAVNYIVTAENGDVASYAVTVVHTDSPEGLFEGFESGALPDGWRTYDEDGNGKSWFVLSYPKYQGNYGIKTKHNKTGNNDWLVTPKVKVRAGDIFSFFARSASTANLEKFNVKISKATNAVADFTTIVADEIIAKTVDREFTEYKYKLEDVAGINVGDEIYIAIQVVSVDAMELHVDNISVAPAPVVPEIELVYKKFWTSVAKVNETKTSVEYRVTNKLAGKLKITSLTDLTGTPFSTTLDKDAVDLAPGDTAKFTFSFNPTAPGEYTQRFAIESNGGTVTIDLSGYAAPEHAYHESFEVEAEYSEWETVDEDGDTHNWRPYKQDPVYSPDLAHTGEHIVFSESALLVGGPVSPNNWLITPRVIVADGDKLAFWVAAVSDVSFQEKYTVKLSENSKKLTDFTEELVPLTELTTNKWSKVEVDLSAYKGKRVYIAIIHTGVSNVSQLMVDDVVTPALYVPTKPDMIVMNPKPEYTMIPKSQANFTFKTKVYNGGTELTDPLKVNFSVEGTAFSTDANLVVPFAPKTAQNVTATEVYTATAKGKFTMIANIDYPGDDDIATNTYKTVYEVSDSTMAREDGVSTNFTKAKGDGELALMYELNKKDTISSVSLMLVTEPNADGSGFTQSNTKVGIKIYKFDGNEPTELVYEEDRVNLVSEGKTWHTIPFYEHTILEPGKYLFSVVNTTENGQILKLSLTENIYTPNTVFVQNGGVWKSLDKINEENDKDYEFTFMIRPNTLNGKKYKKATKPDLIVTPNIPEYISTPLSQASFNFGAKVYNKGEELNKAQNVNFSVEGTSYSNDVALTIPFAKKTEQSVATSEAFVPTEAKEYNVIVNADLSNDIDKSNNKAEFRIAVSDSIMAREDGSLHRILPSNEKIDMFFGVAHDVVVKDTLTSVTFALASFNADEDPVETTAKLDIKIYKKNAKDTTLVKEVKDLSFTTTGTKWHTAYLGKDVVLEPGRYFIGFKDRLDQAIQIPLHEKYFTPKTCVFHNRVGAWYPIEDALKGIKATVMVRANFGNTKGVVKGVRWTKAISPITVNENAESVVIDLSKHATSSDNAPITFAVESNSNADLVNAVIDNNTLTISFAKGKSGKSDIVLKATANGKSAVTSPISVTVNSATSISGTDKIVVSVYPNPTTSNVVVEGTEDANVYLLNSAGVVVYNTYSSDDKVTINSELYPNGVYFIKVMKDGKQHMEKVVFL
jgi:hypothetical protein